MASIDGLGWLFAGPACQRRAHRDFVAPRVSREHAYWHFRHILGDITAQRAGRSACSQIFDWAGAVTFTTGLTALPPAVSLYAFPITGVWVVYVLCVVTAVSFAAFVFVEGRVPQPMPSLRLLATGRFLIDALALIGLATVVNTTPYWVLPVLMAFIGAGADIFFSPNTNAAMSSVRPNERGAASGIRTMPRIPVTCSQSRSRSHSSPQASQRSPVSRLSLRRKS